MEGGARTECGPVEKMLSLPQRCNPIRWLCSRKMSPDLGNVSLEGAQSSGPGDSVLEEHAFLTVGTFTMRPSTLGCLTSLTDAVKKENIPEQRNPSPQQLLNRLVSQAPLGSPPPFASQLYSKGHRFLPAACFRPVASWTLK